MLDWLNSSQEIMFYISQSVEYYEKSAKHTNHWTGAWIVQEQVNEVLYQIRPWREGSKHKSMVVNIV